MDRIRECDARAGGLGGTDGSRCRSGTDSRRPRGRLPHVMSLRRLAWIFPEWWACALCAGAWSVLLLRGPHSGSTLHHASPVSVAEWSTMVFAMMVPLVFAHL